MDNRRRHFTVSRAVQRRVIGAAVLLACLAWHEPPAASMYLDGSAHRPQQLTRVALHALKHPPITRRAREKQLATLIVEPQQGDLMPRARETEFTCGAGRGHDFQHCGL